MTTSRNQTADEVEALALTVGTVEAAFPEPPTSGGGGGHEQTLLKREHLVQERVAKKARDAAALAAATGNVVKYASLGSGSGAKTVGEKAVVCGALVGLVSFFLPWITILGPLSGSGFRIAVDDAAAVWLHPLSMVSCLLVSSFLRGAESGKRILAARLYIAVGILWVAPGVAAVCSGFSGIVGFGGYTATAAAGAIIVGGILQIGERLGDFKEIA